MYINLTYAAHDMCSVTFKMILPPTMELQLYSTQNKCFRFKVYFFSKLHEITSLYLKSETILLSKVESSRSPLNNFATPSFFRDATESETDDREDKDSLCCLKGSGREKRERSVPCPGTFLSTFPQTFSSRTFSLEGRIHTCLHMIVSVYMHTKHNHRSL